MLIGEGVRERQALSCNPFGGASECVTLPVTSSYAETCERNEIEVSLPDVIQKECKSL